MFISSLGLLNTKDFSMLHQLRDGQKLHNLTDCNQLDPVGNMAGEN